MSLAILFHFLCAQHVSDINISIIRSLRLCCWITTSVFLFSVRCVLEIWCGFSLRNEHHLNPATPNLQHTTNWEQKTDVVIQQHSRKLLMMDILMSETCWAHKKWNKIASDIKLVFHSSTTLRVFRNQQTYVTAQHARRLRPSCLYYFEINISCEVVSMEVTVGQGRRREKLLDDL